jgi:outer membrane cobalamin receptor
VHPTERTGLVLGYGQSWLDPQSGADDTGGNVLAGAYLDVLENTRLRGSVARKLRFPSIRQLYDPDRGNPDLDSERSWSYEAAIEQRLPRDTRIALVGYWMELRDFIESISGSPFENRERLRMRGFEVTASSRPWGPLWLWVGYTYLDARDRADGSDFDELQSRPRHKIDAEVRWTLPWGSAVRVGASRVEDTTVYTRNEPIESRKLRDYTLLDLRVEHDLDLAAGRLRVHAGVDNLLDEDWALNYGFIQQGRTFYGGLEYRR